MRRPRTSKIWKLEKDQLQTLLDTSNSMVDVIQKIGLDPYNGNHKTLNQRIKEENLDVSKLNENRKRNQKLHINRITSPIPLDKILTMNSNYNRHDLKIRLIKNKILENKCSECGIDDIWNNKPISLQLDHINGINNDNRLENLRILCPNCHSQTENFSGKKNKIQKKCSECGVKIYKDSKICHKCSSKKSRKFEISKENLNNLIKQYPMTKVGELLGVSDNAVRKRCKILDIDI